MIANCSFSVGDYTKVLFLSAQTERDPYLKGNTSIPVYDPSWQPNTEEEERWDDDSECEGGMEGERGERGGEEGREKGRRVKKEGEGGKRKKEREVSV